MLPIDRQQVRLTSAALVDRLAFASLILVALTFAFEVPLSGFRLGTTSVSIALTNVEMLEGFVIVLWLLSRALARTWPRLPRQLVLPMCAWLAVLLLSTAFAPDYLSHTLRFLSRIVQGVLLAWIAYDLVDSPRRWLLVGGALVIAGALVGLLGLAEATGLPAALNFLLLFRPSQTHVGEVVRISSSLGYATIAAMVLEMLILLTGAWLVTAQRRWLKVVLGLAVGIEIGAMVLTLTRTAVAGLTVALLFVAVMSLLHRQRDNLWAAVGAMGAVFASIVLLLVLNPLLGLRMLSESENGWYQARYSVPSSLTARPNEWVNVPIQLTNAGLRRWQAAVKPVFRLGYTLTHPNDRSFTALDGIHTTLPTDVLPGQTIGVTAQVVSPPRPGVYLIQWDMVEERVLWFSWRGSVPASTQLIVAGEPVANAHPPQLGPANHTTDFPPVERPALWTAALRIFRDKPLLGIGPDDFRWVYGRYLNLDHWDTSIHANNIYLEVLADTGLIGLLAFVWLNWRWMQLAWHNLGRQNDRKLWIWQLALMAALIAWFIHGILDYFYEFTGTNVLFWLIAGLSINASIGTVRQRVQTTIETTG